MKLLNSGNAKTLKGEKLGFITYGLHLAPWKQAGSGNVCASASKGCIKACLNTAGRGKMDMVQDSRIKKTRFFFADRKAFMAQLHKEITAAIKSAKRKGMIPVVRLNLTSDVQFEKSHCFHEGKSLMAWFPEITFYDYTKHFKRLASNLPANYHLTFSRAEDNEEKVDAAIADGHNVAVVFRGSLPAKWKGAKVISGDDHDLRFIDPKGVIVGLVEKGDAKKDDSGFVVSVEGAV